MSLVAPSRVLAGCITAGALIGGLAAPAEAWPMPMTGVAGGACQPDGTRQPVAWVVTNLEAAFPLSPAVVDHVHFVPAFPATDFSPASMPNNGASVAVALMTVPPNWVGSIFFDYRMFWDGPDGSDIRTGSAAVSLDYCFPAVTVSAAARRAGVRVRLGR